MSSSRRWKFLSTPSARRATSTRRLHRSVSILYFYPRPPRGGRPGVSGFCAALALISIHALREEGDCRSMWAYHGRRISIHALREEGDSSSRTLPSQLLKFLSTPSARRATLGVVHVRAQIGISIHALREEGDVARAMVSNVSPYFYPRPPRGGRRSMNFWVFMPSIFLSTPSARRATLMVQRPACALANFYPRPPRGGRPAPHRSYRSSHGFLSTPSARRATEFVRLLVQGVQFLSTPSARRATSSTPSFDPAVTDFYPRPPRGGRRG